MMNSKAIKQEAERIKKEYGYMEDDDFPMAGFMWEFMRRTEEYKEACKVLEKYSLVFDTDTNNFVAKHKVKQDFDGFKNMKLSLTKIPIAITHYCGACPGCRVITYTGEIIGLRERHYYIITYSGGYDNVGMPYHCATGGYPRAEIRYCDFDENARPCIEGLDPVLRWSAKEMFQFALGHAEHTEELVRSIAKVYYEGLHNVPVPEYDPHVIPSKIVVSKYRYPMNLRGGLYRALFHTLIKGYRRWLRELVPTTFHDTIFLGISRSGKPSEILAQVKAIIEKEGTWVEKRKSRAWCQQLATYDLRNRNKFTFPEIMEIINEAFGRHYIDDKDFRKDVYGQAEHMIDKNGYKEHLNRFDPNVNTRTLRQYNKDIASPA